MSYHDYNNVLFEKEGEPWEGYSTILSSPATVQYGSACIVLDPLGNEGCDLFLNAMRHSRLIWWGNISSAVDVACFPHEPGQIYL